MEKQLYMPPQSELLEPQVPLSSIGLLAPAYARIDLTQQQKRYLKERDISCQFPFHHVCTGILHLHHVIPQMYAQIVRNENMYEINDRTRILRVCENIHVGMLGIAAHPDLIHPDQLQAKKNYAVDRHSFQDVSLKHRQLAFDKQPYWNGQNDEEMLDIAAFNTRIYERKFQVSYPTGGVVNGKVIRK